jgi:hypothetical protein
MAASRREFLARSALGFGTLALADLLSRDEANRANEPRTADPLAPREAHYPASAKSVIFLFMTGGPSQVDTFDPKPELARFNGQPLPASFKSDDLKLQFMSASGGTLMATPFAFRRRGQSGIAISDLFREVGSHADDLAVIRSCYHESFIHGPALTIMNSGSLLLGHPSVGSWVVYGLGSESSELPSYVVLTDSVLKAGNAMFSSGFLPAVYQGTLLRSEGAAIANLSPPGAITPRRQRQLLDQLDRWNRAHLDERPGDSRLEARIANYELAFRMQSAAPELIDLAGETAATRAAYGVDQEPTARFGRMCLLARRLVERGVRYVQLLCDGWDGHGECAKNHEGNAARTDKPIAGLLADLKARGLLASTLVVWTGEFGRTPVMQGNQGRDHSPYGFCTWMAGGGIRGGKVIGETDLLGFRAVTDRVHANDLHATMLSLLGLDHTALTYLFEGRERRLTDVGGDNDLSARLMRA